MCATAMRPKWVVACWGVVGLVIAVVVAPKLTNSRASASFRPILAWPWVTGFVLHCCHQWLSLPQDLHVSPLAGHLSDMWLPPQLPQLVISLGCLSPVDLSPLPEVFALPSDDFQQDLPVPPL